MPSMSGCDHVSLYDVRFHELLLMFTPTLQSQRGFKNKLRIPDTPTSLKKLMLSSCYGVDTLFRSGRGAETFTQPRLFTYDTLTR